MRVLVVYGSRSGCARDVAEHIGGVLSKDGHDVSVADADADPSPLGVDLVLAGGGVRANRWNPKVASWMRAHAGELASIKSACFAVSLSGKTPGDCAPTGLEPVSTIGLPGRYRPADVNWLERRVMRQMNVEPAELRDLDAEASWARSVATL